MLKGFFSKFRGAERRKFERYIVNELNPVFFAPDAPSEAQVINISLGGLCLHYSGDRGAMGKSFEMDLTAGDGFQLGRVTVKTLSDRQIKRFSERTEKVRRLGGRFVDMSNLQRLRLEAFLNSYQNKFKRETAGP